MKNRSSTTVEPHHQLPARILIVAVVFCIGLAVMIFIFDLQEKNEHTKAMLQANADAQPPAPTPANKSTSFDTNLLNPLPIFASTNSILN